MNFVFRMEKLAAALRVGCLASEAACEALVPSPAPRLLGRHALPGFTGEFPFFELPWEA